MPSDNVYDIAMEMLNAEVVTENASGKGFKIFISQTSRDANSYIRKARKAKSQGKKNEAKRLYQQALVCLDKMDREAKKIEDESTLDWVASALSLIPVSPLYLSKVATSGGNFKATTRASTLNLIRACKDNVKLEMKSLK